MKLVGCFLRLFVLFWVSCDSLYLIIGISKQKNLEIVITGGVREWCNNYLCIIVNG